MNRLNNNLNSLTETDINFFNLKLERNRILSNSPIKNKRIIAVKKSKSPVELKNKVFLNNDNDSQKIFNNSNLRNTHSKLIFKNNNFLNENKTQYPAIAKKPLLTYSNFNKSNNSIFNEESNLYLENKLYKKKFNCEKKDNLNLILTKNASDTKNSISKESLDSKDSNSYTGTKTEFDNRNPLFSSVNISTKNFNKTNTNFNNNKNSKNNESNIIKNVYSSHDNFIFSNHVNNKQKHLSNFSSTGFLTNKSNNLNEIITEEKNLDEDNFQYSKTEAYNKNEKSDLNLNSNGNNTNKNKNKSNSTRKKTPSQVLNTESNINMFLFNKSSSHPISLSTLDLEFNGYEKAKAAQKKISNLIRSYAANTYQGLVR